MHRQYADIIVDITHKKLDRTFQYSVPEELSEAVEPGMVVEVPFGKGDRLIRGYCIGLRDTPEMDEERIKPIHAVVTDGLGAESRLIALAAWMRSRYGCTMIQALRTVIPVKQRVTPKSQVLVELALPAEEAKAQLAFYERKHQAARARLLRALLENDTLPRSLVREKLHIESPVLKALCKQGVIRLQENQVWRIPQIAGGGAAGHIELNEEQRYAVDIIRREWPESAGSGRYLLHGVTGSGKTQVYMELIAHALERGEQAIVLIPEIALTYQTVLRFYRRFGDQVSFINSRLSQGERYDQFERAKAGEISVMIGPRSALFTPFAHLGLIVIDEEHESAYHSETMPRYSAVETAFQRAKIEGARVVLGSATPSLETYYAAQQGKIRLLTLTQRASGQLPAVQIVDLREEMRRGNRRIVSLALQEKIADTLERGEQVMLFLNRRGYAGFVSCRSCGHVMTCPHCDVSLSLHNGRKLICHYCGHTEPMPQKCPVCGSPFIRSFKAGTQQLVDQVQELFPGARILRMDADTTGKKGDYEKILAAFEERQADILIGTQMIVKGHDFPHVTLVGVLAADLSLHAADYRACERTFQLLTQAVGRAGRAKRPGEAIIQTYDPEHYAVQCAAAQDYETFYEKEIDYRMLGGYPPAGSVTTIHLSGEDEEKLQLAAEYLGKFARRMAPRYSVSVLGPVGESIAKVQDQYRMVLYLKAMKTDQVTLLRELIERYIRINEGYKAISIQYEVEGMII